VVAAVIVVTLATLVTAATPGDYLPGKRGVTSGVIDCRRIKADSRSTGRAAGTVIA